MDRVFGRTRTLSIFRARELVARSLYQSREQAADLIASKIRDRSVRPRRLADTVIEARTGQDNELWHLLILEELVAASDVRENRSGSGWCRS